MWRNYVGGRGSVDVPSPSGLGERSAQAIPAGRRPAKVGVPYLFFFFFPLAGFFAMSGSPCVFATSGCVLGDLVRLESQSRHRRRRSPQGRAGTSPAVVGFDPSESTRHLTRAASFPANRIPEDWQTATPDQPRLKVT